MLERSLKVKNIDTRPPQTVFELKFINIDTRPLQIMLERSLKFINIDTGTPQTMLIRSLKFRIRRKKIPKNKKGTTEL